MSGELNKNPQLPGDWVGEVHPLGFAQLYSIKSHPFSKRSRFQQVDVVDTDYLGKMLLNDSLVMVSEKDESIYHEMMAHVPLALLKSPKKVLVIGGGDGGTAREVLRHPGVEKCVLVEIDEVVVEACRKHIPQTAEVFSHPKLDLVIADGVNYVRDSKEVFDAILIDSTEPIGPAQPLFGPEFYGDLKRLLAEDGALVAQAGSPWLEAEMQKVLAQITSKLFARRGFYNFSNRTYPGGLWSFLFASPSKHPVQHLLPDRIMQPCFYYNSSVHQGAFALPEFQKQGLKEWINI